MNQRLVQAHTQTRPVILHWVSHGIFSPLCESWHLYPRLLLERESGMEGDGGIWCILELVMYTFLQA